MIVHATNDGNNFYKVTEFCKVTKKYVIHNIPESKRYINNKDWYVHASELPYLLKRAKDTQIHTLDYSNIPEDIKHQIDFILFGKKPRVQSNTVSPYTVLHLTSDAPGFIIEAVWKAIVRTSHPDVGGDPEYFIKCKEAYEQIKAK